MYAVLGFEESSSEPDAENCGAEFLDQPPQLEFEGDELPGDTDADGVAEDV